MGFSTAQTLGLQRGQLLKGGDRIPEQGGLDRSIKHAELPRLELVRSRGLSITNPFANRGRVSVEELLRKIKEHEEFLDKNFEQISKYFIQEQFLISAAIDELARAINERSLDLGLYFFQDNVAATQTDVALSNGMSTRGYAAEDFGSITSITVTSNAARTAGTLTVEAIVTDKDDGTVTASGLTAVLDGTNTRSNTSRQDPGTDVFEEGDLLGVRITTTGAWLPITADVDVVLGVRFTGRTR